MDWYTIEFLYPKSFEKFKKTMFPNTGIISLNVLEHYDNKKLYNFFDKQSIFLIVEKIEKNQWVYTITSDDFVLGPGEFQTSRDNIEECGFMDCFRILEKIMNGE